MIQDYRILKTDENPHILPPDERMQEKLSDTGDAFSVRFYEHDFDCHSREHFHWHWHDQLELTIACSDRLLCEIGSANLTLHKGDCILINSGVLHRNMPGESANGRCCWKSLLFGPDLIASPDSMLYKKYVLPIVQSEREFLLFDCTDPWQAQARTQAEHACNIFLTEEFSSELLLKNVLLGFWILLTEHMDYFPVGGSSAKGIDRKRLRQMIKFIWDHYQDHICLEDIAGAAHISARSAQRCFRKGIRMTPNEYLQKYRLQCARTLLLSDDQTILDVALACGFESISYFDRLFRKTYLETPLHYIKRNS